FQIALATSMRAMSRTTRRSPRPATSAMSRSASAESDSGRNHLVTTLLSTTRSGIAHPVLGDLRGAVRERLAPAPIEDRLPMLLHPPEPFERGRRVDRLDRLDDQADPLVLA